MTALARATIEQLLSPEEKTAAQAYADKDDFEKVYFLTVLMRQLRWHRGVTNRELATLWGIGDDKASKLSEQARAAIVMQQRESFQSPDDLRFELKDRYETLVEKAMSATKYVVVDGALEEVPAPNLMAAIAATARTAELFGLGTKRLIKQGNELDKMSDSELAGQVAAALEEKRIREERSKDGRAIEVVEAEGVPDAPTSGDGVGANAEFSSRQGGGDEHRDGRVRSTDRAHPQPGDRGAPSASLRKRRGVSQGDG